MAADAAWRLGPRPVALALAARALRPALRWRLRDVEAPRGQFFQQPQAAPPGLAKAYGEAVLRAAGAVPAPRAEPGFGLVPAAAVRPLAGPDIRPVWERARWAELPLLAKAARLDPGGGHVGRAEAWLAAWLRLNPPYRGPNWACGQEAALRALHLALAGQILGGFAPGVEPLAAVLRRRIAAWPCYAASQDNNHALSEPAGLLACAVMEDDRDAAERQAARLSRVALRLIARDGGFAQDSPAYLRLALDVLSVADLLHPLEAAARRRIAAAALLLLRLADPATGALPRLGHQDGSAFADLSLAGPNDARGSVERALRLFAGSTAGFEDPGCDWLGLQPGTPAPPPAPLWRGGGLLMLQEGDARAVLRLPPRRFRPDQADVLHLDLWDGARNLLPDAGTGSYNPPDEHAWWVHHFPGTAAHNAIAFDGEGQMPAVTRFLHAGWPSGGALPDGGWMRDRRGNRHARRLAVAGRAWVVEDEVSGPFRDLALRWHLAQGDWQRTADGVAGPFGAVAVSADAPLTLSLEESWRSPGYGRVEPAPVLVARAATPVKRLRTDIRLP